MKKIIAWGMTASSLSFLLIASGIVKANAREDVSRKTINAMSFNIRYDNPADKENRWKNRKEMVAATIRFHKTDIAGLQEALNHQVEDLETLLPEFGWFGVGRDDGREAGEFTPVFYRKDRFTVLHRSSFWLSESPEKPGKAWDAACPRIATWGKLEDTLTKKTFFFFNTHFDHVSETARIKSAELLLSKMYETIGDHPVILTGDFNCTEKESPYKILTSGKGRIPGLSDARNLIKFVPYGTTQTYNGFQNTILLDRRIDFIFVGNIDRVFRYGTISERWDGRFVSDHNAVFAEIKMSDRDKDKAVGNPP
ncbi:MAG: endonuclease/exonuclease/phosphatase family protein [Candidatus Aminicenantes bacterium]|jgi:endonuclease/exonuclease/phosphatase family metal-dependent hydrolase